MNWLKSLFFSIVSPTKAGGWARALTASALTAGVAYVAVKIPVIAQVVTPDMVVAVSVAAGTAVTGVLSNISKS